MSLRENMFARLKDWRRIHTRYGRGAHNLLLSHGFVVLRILAALRLTGVVR